MSKLIIAILLFLLGNILIWVQTNGQFLWKWFKNDPHDHFVFLEMVPLTISICFGNVFVFENGTFLNISGESGFGQITAEFSINKGVEKAKETGICVFGQRKAVSRTEIFEARYFRGNCKYS